MWCAVSDESLSATCACHVCVDMCVDMCVLGRVSECDVCVSCITARVCVWMFRCEGRFCCLLRSVFIDFLLSFCLPVILSFSHEMSSEKKSSKTPRPLPSSDEESEDLQFSLASEEVSTYIKKIFG